MVGMAWAQTLEGKKFGVCDLSQVFDAYELTKEYDQEMEKLASDYEKQRTEKIDKIREEQGKLALLNDEETAKLEEKIEKMRAEALEFDRQMRTDLQKVRDDKIRDILLFIEQKVREYAEKENFAVIVNDRVFIYANDIYDITEAIIRLLNEDHAKKKEAKK